MMKTGYLVLVALAIVLLPGAVSAHVPNLVGDAKVVIVNDPEVSQAFYGELRGEPVHFRIVSDKAFKLKVGVLVADLPGADRDFSVSVMKDGLPWRLADSSKVDWKPFHEDFANDDYYSGPELEADAPAGTYDIALFSPDNLGKYVFVVGEREAFGPGAVVSALKTLPEIQTTFFGKSWISAYTNRVGLMLALPIVILAVLASVAFVVFRRKMAAVLPKGIPVTDDRPAVNGRAASVAYRSRPATWRKGKGLDSVEETD